jgi:hypothetical protein
VSFGAFVHAVRELNVGNVGRAGAASASAEDAAAFASAERGAGSSWKGAMDARLEAAKIELELKKGPSGLDHVDKPKDDPSFGNKMAFVSDERR